jgi:hypothetical protein
MTQRHKGATTERRKGRGAQGHKGATTERPKRRKGEWGRGEGEIG